MSVKGIIMFLGMNNTRSERKILIILDFENGFLPTYLPQCTALMLKVIANFAIHQFALHQLYQRLIVLSYEVND